MTVRTNYATNPSFEDASSPFSGWATLAGSVSGFYWRDTSNWYTTQTGYIGASCRINNTASQSNGLVHNLTLPAGTYTVAVMAQILTGTTNAALVVRRHSDSAILGAEQHWTSPNNSWTRKSTSFTLTASTSVDVIIGVGIFTGGPSAGSARFDELLVEQSSTLGTYFDGSFTNTSTTTYAWTGTANASTSTASSGVVTPPPPPTYSGSFTLVEHNDFSGSTVDTSRFYVKNGFAGTNGDGFYHTDRVFISAGSIVIQPDQDYIGGFDSSHRPMTYGKWDVWFKVTPYKGYKGVIFLWPDSEIWNEGELDFVEMTDATGATFQIFFHKPGNPTDNSKQTRITQNITTAFTKASIEWLPDRVSVFVNDIKVFEVTDPTWIPKTPMHLVVQVDVGTPDARNGVATRANYPANLPSPFQLVIDQIDIYKPSTNVGQALTVNDSGTSTDTGSLAVAQNLLTTDTGRSTDTADLTVSRLLAVLDTGASFDVASLTVASNGPDVQLRVIDRGGSADTAALFQSPSYLNIDDFGIGLDSADLSITRDFSVRPQVSQLTEELYAELGPLITDDADNDWALLRYIDAIANRLKPLEDLVRDSDEGPGWSAAMDLDRIPDGWLPWLGQFVGVTVLEDLDSSSQRLRIRETSGFNRGSRAAIEGAARQYLTGTRLARVYERDTSPYHFKVVTFAAETPYPEKTLVAMQAEKPAGLVLDYEISTGQTYGELEATGKTYAELSALYPTYADMKLSVPA